MKLQNKIEKIHPYMDRNFITYPLMEEGNLTPFINFWKIFDDEKHYKEFKKHFKKYKKKYKLNLVENNNKIYNFEIYPKFDYSDEIGYYSLYNYSIEEMVDIVVDIVNRKSKLKKDNETILSEALYELDNMEMKFMKSILNTHSQNFIDEINERIIVKNLQY